MDIALQLLFTGLGVGSIYALVALGFVLIYRGGSSTRAEIYSKRPSKRLLRVIFHRKTAKKGIWSRVIAWNTCVQCGLYAGFFRQRLYCTQ